MSRASVTLLQSSSTDAFFISPQEVMACSVLTTHSAYNLRTLPLNGMFNDTSRGCSINMKPPGMSANQSVAPSPSSTESNMPPWKPFFLAIMSDWCVIIPSERAHPSSRRLHIIKKCCFNLWIFSGLRSTESLVRVLLVAFSCLCCRGQ